MAEGEGQEEEAKSRSLVPSSEVSSSLSQKSSGKYPKVQELLQGRRARCYLLPALGGQWASKGHGSPSGKCPREPSSRPPPGPWPQRTSPSL